MTPAPDTSPEAVERLAGILDAGHKRYAPVLHDDLESAAALLRALSGELARARVNEARYRWLREVRDTQNSIAVVLWSAADDEDDSVTGHNLYLDSMDAVIDAAMSQGPSHG